MLSHRAKVAAAVAWAFLLGAPVIARSGGQAGVVDVWVRPCSMDKANLRLYLAALPIHTATSLVDTSAMLAGKRHDRATFSLQEGSWRGAFTGMRCSAEVKFGVLSGHRRSLNVLLKAPPASIIGTPFPGENDIYDTAPTGNVAGLIPQGGVSVWAESTSHKAYAAEVEDGAYYLDSIPVGAYTLHIRGSNWSSSRKLVVPRVAGLVRADLGN